MRTGVSGWRRAAVPLIALTFAWGVPLAAAAEPSTERANAPLPPGLDLRPGTGPCAGLYESATRIVRDGAPRACYHGLEVFLSEAADPAPVVEALRGIGHDITVHDHGTSTHVHGDGPVQIVTLPAPAVERRVVRSAIGTTAITLPAIPPGIPCVGGSGPTVQVFYVRHPTVPDRAAAVSHVIREAVAIADDIVSDSAAQVGKVRHVRWKTTAVSGGTCDLVIGKATSANGDPGSIADALAGKVPAGSKVLAFYDDSWFGGCGGLGSLFDDSRPSPTQNINNTGYDVQVAAVYGSCFTAFAEVLVGGSVAAHELFHTFGAVQPGAPNSTGYGFHCTDEWDVMCYKDSSSTVLKVVCPKRSPELLDCNKDDYFNPGTPPTGSYLATHWNTAKSSWLTSAQPTARDPMERPGVSVGGLPANGYVGGAIAPTASPAPQPGTSADSVDFYVDGKLVSTDQTAPFRMEPLETAWDGDEGYPNGAKITIQTVIRDSLGREGISAPRTVTIANPKVRLTAPMSGSGSRSVTWSAAATASGGRTVSKVELLRDGVVVATDSTSPYGGTIVLPSYPLGELAGLEARVTDSAGVSRTSAPRFADVIRPEVKLLDPAWGSIVRGPTVIAADARTIPGRSIAKVDFLVEGAIVGTDTTAPFTTLWDPSATAGYRTIVARATDSSGLTGETEPMDVSLRSLLSFDVDLHEPSDGSTVSGTAVPVSATATPTGPWEVSVVSYMLDGMSIAGTSNGPDWATTFDTTYLGPGWHSLRAVASFYNPNNGTWLEATSLARSVRIGGTISTSITAPAEGAAVKGNVAVKVDATWPAGRSLYSSELAVDGDLQGWAYTDPATFTLATRDLVDGRHALRARTTLSDGSSAWSVARRIEVANTGVQLSGPAAGATVAGAVTLSATVTRDAEAIVEWVRFYVDGVQVGADFRGAYAVSWDSTDVADGAHTVEARLVTTDGRSFSSPTRTITVTN